VSGHSTAAEAARVALDAGGRRLVLTHLSSRYNRDTSELLAEAKAVFPETVIARDGMTIEVPYSDAE
jgi:ribonuclease Z